MCQRPVMYQLFWTSDDLVAPKVEHKWSLKVNLKAEQKTGDTIDGSDIMSGTYRPKYCQKYNKVLCSVCALSANFKIL